MAIERVLAKQGTPPIMKFLFKAIVRGYMNLFENWSQNQVCMYIYISKVKILWEGNEIWKTSPTCIDV